MNIIYSEELLNQAHEAGINKITVLDGDTGETVRAINLPLCEVCGDGPANLTADPDKGGLMLCEDCRKFFGFEVKGE